MNIIILRFASKMNILECLFGELNDILKRFDIG